MEFYGVIYQGTEVTDHNTLASLPDDLITFFNQVNGLVAYYGGLHIRGCVMTPDWHSLHHYWKGEGALHKTYGHLTSQDIPFAQDCMGDQFFLREKHVFSLNGETGETKSLDLSFNQFITKVIEDPIEFLMLQPLQQFHNEGGHLSPGELLDVYPPFCITTPEGSVSLKKISVQGRLQYLADLYRQIKETDDGKEIKLLTIE